MFFVDAGIASDSQKVSASDLLGAMRFSKHSRTRARVLVETDGILQPVAVNNGKGWIIQPLAKELRLWPTK